MGIIPYNCQSISPMFIGNANPKDAELRPGVIKASLRFWWRALHPNLSLIELKKQEAELFGGTYLTKKDEELVSEHKRPSFRILPIIYDKDSVDEHFIDARPEKNNKSFAILPKLNFEIKIIILDVSKKEQIKSLFYVASVLGGLGKRARRGAGAWKINNMKYDKNIIDKNILKINSDYKTIYKDKNNSNAAFPFIMDYSLGVDYENEIKLREKIMRISHKAKTENLNLFKEYLGNFNPRLASPVYVSMIDVDDKKVKPIITQLNFKKNRNHNLNIDGEKLQQKFKNAILNNTDYE